MLLALPAELRNAIYRFALVENDRIQITDQKPPPSEPGLLSVNKQVRKEARGIYHKENIFRFHVADYDITILLKWCAVSFRRRTSRFNYLINRSHNWPTLLAWLKAYYEDRCGKVGERHDKEPCLIYSLFSMVGEMKVEQKLTWDQVATNLEHVHQGLIATKSGWQ